MKFFLVFVFTSILATAGTVISLAAASEMQGVLPKTIDFKLPEPKKRIDPRYPTEYARGGLEGWVQLTFSINEKGKVADIKIVDSTGYKLFEREAVKALKKWRYTPAHLDGQPISYTKNAVRLDFSLGDGTDTISDDLRNSYSQFYDKTEANDISSAQSIIDNINKTKTANLTEHVLKQKLKADHYALINDQASRYIALDDAFHSLKWTGLADPFVSNYITSLINAAAITGKFVEAREVYKEVFTDQDIEPNESVVTIMRYIEQEMKSPEPFLTESIINNHESTHFSLHRRKFSVNKTEGSVDELELRCDEQFASITTFDDTIYTIPDDWGSCVLRFLGEQNSRVSVMQYAN